MKALVYRNTKSPVWGAVHKTQERGVAYETDERFVHIFGTSESLWTISPGLTVTDKKDGELCDWVKGKFGAEYIEQSELDVGCTIEGVWRPGLSNDRELLQGLAQTNVHLRRAEQSLLLLLEKLDALLLFVEPTIQSLAMYSHKARELLILACSEIEAHWLYYLRRAEIKPKNQHFTTYDYVKLRNPLYLHEFEVSLPRHEEVAPIRPFFEWSKSPGPTKTLRWYDAYNKTKHDPQGSFSAATLDACLQAVAANIVMFCVRFGPYRLHLGGGMLSALFNPTFAVSLRDCRPKTFYVPEMDIGDDIDGMVWGHFEPLPRTPKPLEL